MHRGGSSLPANPEDATFPLNIEVTLRNRVASWPEVDQVFRRPIRPVDPTACVGVFVDDWMPGEMNIGQYSPATAPFNFQIQTIVRNAEEEEGRRASVTFSKNLRTMLYRDMVLRALLKQLQESSDGVTERLTRWGVRRLRYASNEIRGEWIYMAALHCWFETEILG